MRLTDRGFTLIELLIALVLASVVIMGVYRAMIGSQQTTEALAQRIDVQQNLRGGVQYLAAALRELDAEDGDIAAATATMVQFRSMQWTGVLCADPVASGPGVRLLVRTAPFYGIRNPDNQLDSILLYRDGDPATDGDDLWLIGAVATVGSATCLDGSAAFDVDAAITAASGGAAAALAGVTAGAPIRGFQMEEVALKPGPEARWWMSQRMADKAGTWTSVEAMIGALTAAGLDLAYFDDTGAPTTQLDKIVSVGLVVRAESRQMMRVAPGTVGYATDSLITRVALRNNPAF